MSRWRSFCSRSGTPGCFQVTLRSAARSRDGSALQRGRLAWRRPPQSPVRWQGSICWSRISTFRAFGFQWLLRPTNRGWRVASTSEPYRQTDVASSFLSLLGLEGRSDWSFEAFDTDSFQELPRTDGASSPFWAPDSRFIGFLAEGKLKRINMTGSPPVVVCEASGLGGGTWNRRERHRVLGRQWPIVPGGGGRRNAGATDETGPEAARDGAPSPVVLTRWASFSLRRDGDVHGHDGICTGRSI